MKKVLFSMVLAAALFFAVSKAAVASYCYLWNPVLGQCETWAPSPLPGFVTVANNYALVAGDFVMCDSGGAFCQKTNIGTGGFYNLANLGDWGEGGWYVKTIKSKLARNWYMYCDQNWAGGWSGYYSGGALLTVSNVDSVVPCKVDSLILQN